MARSHPQNTRLETVAVLLLPTRPAAGALAGSAVARMPLPPVCASAPAGRRRPGICRCCCVPVRPRRLGFRSGRRHLCFAECRRHRARGAPLLVDRPPWQTRMENRCLPFAVVRCATPAPPCSGRLPLLLCAGAAAPVRSGVPCGFFPAGATLGPPAPRRRQWEPAGTAAPAVVPLCRRGRAPCAGASGPVRAREAGVCAPAGRRCLDLCSGLRPRRRRRPARLPGRLETLPTAFQAVQPMSQPRPTASKKTTALLNP